MNMKRFLDQETGSAMVISLMTLVLLTMLGSVFMLQTNTETQLAAHDMRATQALFNAEAGYAEVMARMDNSADTTNYVGEATGVITPGWGIYLVLEAGNALEDPDYYNTLSDGLDNDGDGLIDENGELHPEFLTAQAGADTINYPWVHLTYKMDGANQVLLFGDDDQDVQTNPTFNPWVGLPALTIVAHGGQGKAQRTLEIDAVRQPNPPLPSGAIYTEADSTKFNGTSFLISGLDHDLLTGLPIPGAPEAAGISTTGDPSTVTNELDASQSNNVEGDGGEPSVMQSDVDMDLSAIADQFIPLADNVLTAGASYSNETWGTMGAYEITYCPGDLKLSGGSTGAGLLIVAGNFEVSGQHSWTGVTLVLGDATFSGGGNNVHLFGTTLVGGEFVIGGNADLVYSSQAIAEFYKIAPYIVVNWKEQN